MSARYVRRSELFFHSCLKVGYCNLLIPLHRSLIKRVVYVGEARPNYLSAQALLEDCPILVSASRFEQVRTFRQWLLPTFRKVVDR